MADQIYQPSARSKRAQTILNMVSDKPSQSVENNPRQPSLKDLYTRPYSMTSNVFDTFCETQTTYNTHHFSNLNTEILNEAFPEKVCDGETNTMQIKSSSSHRHEALPVIDNVFIDLAGVENRPIEQFSFFNETIITPPQIIAQDLATSTLNSPLHGMRKNISELTCNEILAYEESLFCNSIEPSVSLKITGNPSKHATPEDNLPNDFDSDDSVRDKDFFPSDFSDNSSDDCTSITPERQKRPQLKIENNNRTLQSVSAPKITKNLQDFNTTFPADKSNALQQKRRNSIDLITKKALTMSAPLSRKRRYTIEIASYQTLSMDSTNTTVSLDSETLQPPRKRKTYNSTLLQRKMDAKLKRKLEHSVKTGCNEKCTKKCTSRFNHEERVAINQSYWDMSWQEQHNFVKAHTSVAIPNRKSSKIPQRKPKRSFTLKKLNNTRFEVCKVFFLTTLGYVKTNDRILHNTFTELSTDKRGKHQKTPAFDRDLLTQHVETFNPLEPHYRREHAPMRRYLPSDLNIVFMFRDFCDKYPDKKISYELYRKHVKKMNIAFTRLGNEECETCETYNLHKNETTHDATVTVAANCTVCIKWAKHHDKYKRARVLYDEHKQMPKNGSQVYFSADLEKVIMLPRMETFKAVIFCQRLVAYNQTFAPVGKITSESKPLTAIWHDGIAGRKQEDIMSAFYQFFLSNRDVVTVNLWLDNCSAQNKNWLLYSLIVHLINSSVISTENIILHYFEPGHTFMSCDQVHHQVELAMKKKGKLYDFFDFENAVASINNSKVIVKSMSANDFLNVPNYVSDRRIQNSNPRAYLKDMSEVYFNRNNYDIKYKNNFDDEYTQLRFMNEKYIKNPSIMKLEFRSEPKGVDSDRKADVMKKISDIIPAHKLLFWQNLPAKVNVNDDATTSGTRNKKKS